jgi:hypothetical protein
MTDDSAIAAIKHDRTQRQVVEEIHRRSN